MADKVKISKRNEKKSNKRNELDKMRESDRNPSSDTCDGKQENGKSKSGQKSGHNPERVGYTSMGCLPFTKFKKERKSEAMERRKLAELMEAFHLFDFDRDGIISFSDLKKVFASLGRGETDDEQIKQMMAEGGTPLDFDAFVKLMGLRILDLDEEDTLVEALSHWDYGNGLISEERIRHDLMTWGDKFTVEEADAALEHAPIVITKNKEKMIDYVQFSNDLCGFRKAKSFLEGK